MPTAIFLSPHLDDAVFSAGGTMATLVDRGWRVVMATVFTGSMPNPSGFALRCQTDKRLAPDVDYMSLRRAEDAAAARRLGLEAEDVHWLGLPEAPHRGYEDAKQLFAGVHADDEGTVADVAERIARFVGEPDIIFAPLGVGDHVDHVQVIRALDLLKPQALIVRWYDAPYVARLVKLPIGDVACDVSTTFRRKLNACAACTTQIGFQFGGEQSMSDRMLTSALRMAAESSLTLAERFECGGAMSKTTARALDLLPQPPFRLAAFTQPANDYQARIEVDRLDLAKPDHP